MGTYRPNAIVDLLRSRTYQIDLREPLPPNSWRCRPVPTKPPPRYSPYFIHRLQKFGDPKVSVEMVTPPNSNSNLNMAPRPAHTPNRSPIPQTRHNVKQLNLAAQLTEFEQVLQQVTGNTGTGSIPGGAQIQGPLGNPALNYIRPTWTRLPPPSAAPSATTSTTNLGRAFIEENNRRDEDLILKIRQEIEKEARRFESTAGSSSTRPREDVGGTGSEVRGKTTPTNNTKPKVTQFPPSAEEGSECIICLEDKKSHILIPCGHYSYCEKCAKSMKNCALCRKKITKRVKVFES